MGAVPRQSVLARIETRPLEFCPALLGQSASSGHAASSYRCKEEIWTLWSVESKK
jgi:hypothetical protein